jgi:hypothetical protein
LGGGAVSEPSICRSYGKKDDDWWCPKYTYTLMPCA